jgi:hypothetical protein
MRLLSRVAFSTFRKYGKTYGKFLFGNGFKAGVCGAIFGENRAKIAFFLDMEIARKRCV